MAFHPAPEARGTSYAAAGVRFRAQILALGLAAGLCGPVPAAELEARTQPVPPLRLDAVDGGSIGLADLTGRPVLVHFFATWCEPCVQELASLDRLSARGGIAVLAVDVGEVDARVRRFLEAHPMRFPVALDRDRSVTRRWGVVGLPSSFLLDPRHTAVGFVEGDLTWDDPAVVRRMNDLIGSGEAEENEPT